MKRAGILTSDSTSILCQVDDDTLHYLLAEHLGHGISNALVEPRVEDHETAVQSELDLLIRLVVASLLDGGGQSACRKTAATSSHNLRNASDGDAVCVGNEVLGDSEVLDDGLANVSYGVGVLGEVGPRRCLECRHDWGD